MTSHNIYPHLTTRVSDLVDYSLPDYLSCADEIEHTLRDNNQHCQSSVSRFPKQHGDKHVGEDSSRQFRRNNITDRRSNQQRGDRPERPQKYGRRDIHLPPLGQPGGIDDSLRMMGPADSVKMGRIPHTIY